MLVVELGTFGFVSQTTRVPLAVLNLEKGWAAGWTGGDMLAVKAELGPLTPSTLYRVRVEGFVGRGKDRHKWASEAKKLHVPAAATRAGTAAVRTVLVDWSIRVLRPCRPDRRQRREYLRRRRAEADEVPQVETLAGGVSNVVLPSRPAGRRFVLKQSRPRLRADGVVLRCRTDLPRTAGDGAARTLLPPGIIPKIAVRQSTSPYLFAMEHAPIEARPWKEHLLAGEVDWAVGEQAGGHISGRFTNRRPPVGRAGAARRLPRGVRPAARRSVLSLYSSGCIPTWRTRSS
ncbi:MAG: hypothetical protein U0736_00780 [Gemmataceae bacterium]